MSGMFSNCKALASLDVSGWDTSVVTNMEGMFRGCQALESLDVTGWDTGSVTDMGYMFSRCQALASLDVSGWDTGAVTYTVSMFRGCASLSSLDLSSWDTSNIANGRIMFDNCPSLKSLKVWSNYQIKSAHMFPAATSDYGWWSMADSAWYTREEVVSGRSGTADEYLAKKDLERFGAEITLPQGSYEPTGQAIEPVPTVKIGDEELVPGNAYDVSYEGNVEVGTATVKVTGKGMYGGTISATFEIAEATSKSLEGAAVTLSKGSYVYAGTHRKPAPTVKLGDETLTEGTDYDVSYRDNVNAGTATVTVTGRGDYKGSKQVTFNITRKALSGAEVTLSKTSYTYAGVCRKPAVASVTLIGKELIEGTDYEVSYRNNLNTGTATAVVRGVGNYKGTATAAFNITKRSLADADVSLDGESFDATGQPVEPAVRASYNGAELSEGKDFEVTYSDNVEPGRAKATVKGIGNYKGGVELTFEVVVAKA
jgi:surface protein